MGLLSKARLYFDTARHLKPSQIAYRLWKKAGGKIRLRKGRRVSGDIAKASISNIPPIEELDFDPAFLSRFDVDGIMEDRISLLHHEEKIDWNNNWYIEGVAPLWEFNLHYCEYLLPLIKEYHDTKDDQYLEKAKSIISGWIKANPQNKGGAAWDSYVISMRIANWLAFYGEAQEGVEADDEFIAMLNSSLLEQYEHLSCHLEKDILANHYMENLKALALLSCYFEDWAMLDHVLVVLKSQVDEQILPDGMHFELSPMYHKVVFESLIRVACVLKASGVDLDAAEWLRLQDIVDCLATLEGGVDRTPLFNDSGDNVAKSRNSLLSSARRLFGIIPHAKDRLPNAGYYVLERETLGGKIKLIFDAGEPGPRFAAGHAHCDMLSFEVFVDGKPWIVNSGTYAYQDEKRLYYKSSDAHNSPHVTGVEQSECWGSFRLARMAKIVSVQCDKSSIMAKMRDYAGNEIERHIELSEVGISVTDKTRKGEKLVSTIHLPEVFENEFSYSSSQCLYSPEFGLLEIAEKIEFEGNGRLEYLIPWPVSKRKEA